MKSVSINELQKLNIPQKGSHKGQNGRLLVIGGSHLFHAASLWSLEVASRIVDLVHFASVPENNELAKNMFRNGIVIPRENIHEYIEEDDCILIGPGMLRDKETKEITHTLLTTYPHKQWVIDAGALQMLDLADVPVNAILTPHHGEFTQLWAKMNNAINPTNTPTRLINEPMRQWNNESGGSALSDFDKVRLFAKKYHCVVLLKGERDITVNSTEERVVVGGNEGMTKGGTGDVLAGLIAALACKNDSFLATIAGSYINKVAGDSLYISTGPFFNASDLALQIPKTMKHLLKYLTRPL